MEIKTFRAKTMQAALNLVREELGPEATVLHTRELNTGIVSRMLKGQAFEIAASAELAVSSQASAAMEVSPEPEPVLTTTAPELEFDYSTRFREHLHHQSNEELNELHELAEQLRERSNPTPSQHLPDAMFQVYTDMIEADIEEVIAQELVERLRDESSHTHSLTTLKANLVRMLEEDLQTTGPIEAAAGQGKVVALVGPTGVGKTTTIAKLAANYRLRENKRVGLITVDTYRIAAVEQLRTYADIIDLPMEIVSTPREMREAIDRMSDLDLILMDTAGRSPRDEVKIQELKSMLSEAKPDEVHLVLSAVGGARSLKTTAERFATVGTTSLLFTKLDEATTFGNLLSVTRSCNLPIGYLTDGQNVPDDIRVAESRELAETILQSN